MLGNPEEALTDLDYAYNIVTLTNQGRVKWLLSITEEALADFDCADALQPNNAAIL